MKDDKRDLNYYATCDKIYWVVAKDIYWGSDPIFKQYDKVPCIFVEERIGGEKAILQLDFEIKDDSYRYTAWRKLIGQAYGIRVGVYLINKDMNGYDSYEMFDLDGESVHFEDFVRSDLHIDKTFLAKFDHKIADVETKPAGTFEEATGMFFYLQNYMDWAQMISIFPEHTVPDLYEPDELHNHFWHKYHEQNAKNAVLFYFSLTPNNQERVRAWGVRMVAKHGSP